MMKQKEVWTVAVGQVRPFAIGRLRKAQNAAINLIKRSDGFLGVHPVPGRGTLLLYESENDAKRAKNLLNAYGCQTGKNICNVYIPIEYYEQAIAKRKGGGQDA